jgi:hypothetical protein
VPNHCRPVDTGSVPFLSQVCSDEQLFPRCPGANSVEKPNYETALNDASFPAALSAVTRWSVCASRRSRVAGEESRITVAKSWITSRQPLITRDAVSHWCAAIRNDRNSNVLNAQSLSSRFQKHVFWHTFCATPHAGRASQSGLRGAPAIGRGPLRRSRITRHTIPNSRYNHAFLGAAGESNT